MESESKNNTADEFEHQIIDNILLKDDLGNSIQDLLLNNLLSKENKLREGMTTEDFDIIFSTQEAINKEILHTLIVVPNKYDQKTKYCQLLKKEEVKFTEDKYDEFNKLVKNHYKSFKIMLTPRIRRNLRFDFTVLKYKIIIDGKIENYQFKHESKDKDILCLISHKLKKDPHINLENNCKS